MSSFGFVQDKLRPPQGGEIPEMASYKRRSGGFLIPLRSIRNDITDFVDQISLGSIDSKGIVFHLLASPGVPEPAQAAHQQADYRQS